ncbi:50S ribosomal protein L23Ae [Plasmodium inui San Antonio 1]|uniref:50S ribosomal protein L23Ae n=1 Tax=Plasmodium inui San Antonio 1 TaxID=1237626 RepID=W7A7L6_9APIC|nr:50S ribosomal protein L23Ae [Plasmodium inui San Antonio 1]EUD69162.1 50S ribosomal protein L23Ae [Plasmodium inui San Antonio 1]
MVEGTNDKSKKKRSGSVEWSNWETTLDKKKQDSKNKKNAKNVKGNPKAAAGGNDKMAKKKGTAKEKKELYKGKVKKTLGKHVGGKNQQVKKGAAEESKKKKKKMITSIRFKRPKTLKLPKNPKCPKIIKSCYKKTLDKYGILKYPLTSEKAMKKIEEINTLVFICDKRADKKKIKKSVRNLFGINCEKVNVLNRLNGDKKAYVRLSKDHDALEVANKIGIL